MRKVLISLVVVVGLFLALASGCAMMAERPQPTSAPTTSPQATQLTQPSTDAPTAPTAGPTLPAEMPTEPPVTQTPATDPPTTKPSLPQDPDEKLTICIDAGHQRYGISEKEPNGPGSDVMKVKLTSGTRGVSTKIAEYQLNLDVALLLEQELLSRGYNVIMIRRTNDCPLSNAERAQVANESGADIFIRLHGNSIADGKVSGALCCAPTQNNSFLTGQVIADSIRLSRLVVNSFCEATGAKNRGLMSTDTMTGINWCQIPVTIVEMGFMFNATEDEMMATDDYREKMVLGIANGIDAYFGL